VDTYPSIMAYARSTHRNGVRTVITGDGVILDWGIQPHSTHTILSVTLPHQLPYNYSGTILELNGMWQGDILLTHVAISNISF
jgi:hypothetical protein